MIRDNFRHGFSELEWESAKIEIKEILKTRMKSGSLITYASLVSHLKVIQLDARDTRLAHLLGEVSAEEHEQGRPLITALVVRKQDMHPGKGFFVLARSLGFSFEDDDKFWSEQVASLQQRA